MDFAGLFRRETDENELSTPARRVLSGVRSGKTIEEAAREEKVSAEDLRKWMREPAYRAALRRKPPSARCISMADVQREMFERGELGDPDPHAPPPPSTSALELERKGWKTSWLGDGS